MSPIRFASLVCLLLLAPVVAAQQPPRPDPLAGKLVLMANPEVPYFVPKDGKWQEAGKIPRPMAVVRQTTEGAYRVLAGEMDGWVRKGEVVLLDDAAAYFTERIQRDPKDAFAHRQRAISLSEQRYTDYDEALVDLDEAIRLQPNDSVSWRTRGLVRAFKGDNDRAMADLNESIRLDPNSADAYNKRANLWGRRERPSLAMTDIEEAIRREPRCGDHYAQRGCVWFAKRERDKGWADLDKAVAVSPEIGWFHGMRAQWHQQFGELSQAVADLDQAAALEPNVARWYADRSHVRLLQIDYPSAIADIDQALKLDPTNSIFYLKKMEICVVRKMWDDALAVANEGLKVCPKHKADLYGNRAGCELIKGDYRAALADLDAALREAPNSTHYQVARAELLATCADKSLRDLDRAITEATHIAEKGEFKDAVALDRVAFYCSLAGRTQEAEQWRAKAQALKPAKVTETTLPPLPPPSKP